MSNVAERLEFVSPFPSQAEKNLPDVEPNADNVESWPYDIEASPGNVETK